MKKCNECGAVKKTNIGLFCVSCRFRREMPNPTPKDMQKRAYIQERLKIGLKQVEIAKELRLSTQRISKLISN